MLFTAAQCSETSAHSRLRAPQRCWESTQGANPAGHYRCSHSPRAGSRTVATQQMPSANSGCPKPLQQPAWGQPSRNPMVAAHPRALCALTPPPCRVHPTWLMSLVHAAFSCLDEATRITVKDGESFGSTTILKSRWSMSCPDAFALEKEEPHTVIVKRLPHPLSPSVAFIKVLRSLLHFVGCLQQGHDTFAGQRLRVCKVKSACHERSMASLLGPQRCVPGENLAPQHVLENSSQEQEKGAWAFSQVCS